uniref:Uncharacterized protein n=1 Tax=Arundo donax TaxID=35708 RepID=A0A0A9F3D4_ARUDO
MPLPLLLMMMKNSVKRRIFSQNFLVSLVGTTCYNIAFIN